jgi:uncharacterized membrane protein
MKLCLKSSVLVAATVAALFTFVCPSPAAADGLTVCNKSTYGTVNVAVAVDWLDNGNPYEEAEGWFIIAQGDCKIVIDQDVRPYEIFIYAYANKNPAKLWWGGNNPFCLELQKFLYRAGEEKPPCRSGRSYGMRHIDTGDNTSYTYTLHD